MNSVEERQLGEIGSRYREQRRGDVVGRRCKPTNMVSVGVGDAKKLLGASRERQFGLVVSGHHVEAVSIVGVNGHSPAIDRTGSQKMGDHHGPNPQDRCDRCQPCLCATRADEGQQIGQHRPRARVGSKSALGFVPAPFFEHVRESHVPNQPHAPARLVLGTCTGRLT